jgi:L-fuconolactonase
VTQCPTIVDAHVHFWDPGRISYPWLSGVPALDHPLLLDDYLVALGENPIEAMVFVECDAAPGAVIEEAHWISTIASSDPRLRAVVASAPLERGDAARDVLDELCTNSLVKGIRRIIQFEADPDFCVQPGFVKGVRSLADLGLTFDICIAWHQLERVFELASAAPETTMVLDHIGKPPIVSGQMEPWLQGLRKLASLPNVHCKLSGVATEADHASWTRDQLLPYMDAAVECFGFEKLIFGGDWPVATQAISLADWIEFMRDYMQQFSEQKNRKFWRDNANTIYRLGLDP